MARPHANTPETDASTPPAPLVAAETKFETALMELEQIVLNMESGQLSLEDSIAAYRRGSALLKHCQQQLSEAERKIQILENDSLRDFEPARGES